MTGEILEHLLLRCDIAYEFWIYAFFFLCRTNLEFVYIYGGFRVGKKKNQREVRAVQGLCEQYLNSNPRKKEEKIKKREKEKEITKANVPIAQNTQFY